MSDQFNGYNDNEEFNNTQNTQSNEQQPSEYSYNQINNNESSNEENNSEPQGSVYRYTHVSREDYSNSTQDDTSTGDTYQETSFYNGTSNQNSNDYYQEASPSNVPVKRKKNKRKKDHSKMKRVAAVAAAGLVVVGAAVGGAFAGIQYMKNNFVTKDQVATTTNNQVVLTKSGDTAADTASASDSGLKVLDVSGIVQQVKPSIVAITNTLEYTTEISNDPLSQFFGAGQSQTQTQEAQAYGSGVIVGKTDEALLIVTNNHVTAADSGEESSGLRFYTYSATSKNISVEFNDGTTADAIVQGTDEAMDLAVIQVPLENIQEGTLNNIAVATIGNSDACQEGNGVIAIGNALGEGTSTTVGYISALNRKVTIDGYERTLLQTDAAINPGNSGGGLFNTNGELIGINSAKYSAEEVEGVGYAIPITSAEEIITKLMNQEVRTEVAEEKRGYLGVTVIDISDTYVQNNNYPKGASIQQITEGSPADQAGLNIYDIITAVNGNSVDGKNALRSELNYYEVGETVELTVQHPSGNGFEEKTVSVTLASKDSVTVQEDQTQASK